MKLLLAYLGVALASTLTALGEGRSVSIVSDAALGPAAQHGMEKLTQALAAASWEVRVVHAETEVHGSQRIFVGTSRPLGAAAKALQAAHFALPSVSEALTIEHLKPTGDLVVCGADDHGLMYALLDVADRVGWAQGSADPFSAVHDTVEQPTIHDRALSVYTMNRAYWESRFYDETYWNRYFDQLAADRFNRFLIVFGYENGGFLAPPYPYFFPTPGFENVHMVGLSPAQQQVNLAALNRLIALAHARGIAVTLGIWDHIYRGDVQTGGAEWLNHYKGQPVPNTVEGVTSENLSTYTLAALKELLARVPAVDSLQFRAHEESGLKREEMNGFWREVFQSIQKQKPGMLVEVRGKGTPDSVIETAIAQGVNLRVETKIWMEQMGLPFHPTHTNPEDQHNRRHGYADFLRYPQIYHLDWRLWNGGTSRILLWGDPDYIRRLSTSVQLYESPNWDVQEPLATKMEAQRPDLPVFALMPDKYRYYQYEFERYWYFFELWGRLGYNPDTPPEVWGHEFKRRFGDQAAPHVEKALARASTILPMIVASQVYPYSGFPTTRGWAERQSLGPALKDYAKNTGSDVQQFESFDDAAKRILSGGTTPKRTPEATAQWFAATANVVLGETQAAEAAIGSKRGPEFDSTVIDLKILAQLARYHSHRAIAAVHYALFQHRQNRAELLAATSSDKAAVAAWRELVAVAGDHYNFDLAMGARDFSLCGHWRDELVKLESDLKNLEAQCAESEATGKVWQPPSPANRVEPNLEHIPAASAKPGKPLRIVARVLDQAGVMSVTLRYRHLTQYENYETEEMLPTGEAGVYAATVPGNFLVSRWDFMYFFEIIDRSGQGTMWPDLAKQAPYIIVKMER